MRVRRAEPRIVDPATHPRRYVSPTVAAAFLEVDRKTFRKYLDGGLIAYEQYPHRVKIAVAELVAFRERHRRPARTA